MEFDGTALPNELRRRANEVYGATAIDLSILHQVAYRLEAQARRVVELEVELEELKHDIARYIQISADQADEIAMLTSGTSG